MKSTYHIILIMNVYTVISRIISYLIYISVAVGDFSTRGCCPKNNLHFLKFYFNFCFFLQMSNTASFSLFFKFSIRFLKNIFWVLRPKWILLCVSDDRIQKLILAGYDILSIAFLVIYDLMLILRVLSNGLV